MSFVLNSDYPESIEKGTKRCRKAVERVRNAAHQRCLTSYGPLGRDARTSDWHIRRPCLDPGASCRYRIAVRWMVGGRQDRYQESNRKADLKMENDNLRPIAAESQSCGCDAAIGRMKSGKACACGASASLPISTPRAESQRDSDPLNLRRKR